MRSYSRGHKQYNQFSRGQKKRTGQAIQPLDQVEHKKCIQAKLAILTRNPALSNVFLTCENYHPFKHPLSSLRALAGQTAAYGLSTIIGRTLNYLLVPLYTRLFLPEAYGVVTDLYALVAFLNVVYSYGMETAFFRRASEKGEQAYGTAFWSLTLSSIVFTALLIAGANPLAAALRYPEHQEYVVWFAFILGLDALAVIPFARLRQQEKALRFASLKLINIGLNVGLNLFFLLVLPHWSETRQFLSLVDAVYDPTLGVGYIFLSNLLANGITLLLLVPTFPRFRGRFDPQLWREMFVYGLPLLPAGLAGMVNETFDRILLKYLLPGEVSENLYQVGVYGAVYKLAMLMSLFTQAFRTAAEPFFFQQAKQLGAPQLYARIMNYFVFAGSLILVGVVLFLDIVKAFIGAAYHEGLGVVPILLVANLMLGIYYNQSVWYKLADKTRYGMWFSLFGAALTIGLNVLLIPILGYYGAAWTTLAAYSAMVLVSYVYGQRHYPVPYALARLASYIGLALVLVAIELVLLSRHTGYWVWAMRIGLCLAYVMFGWWREKPIKSVT